MALDPATQWFLDDARRQGLTLSEYERRYGVILSLESTMPLPSPAEQRIRRNEVNAGSVSEDDLALVTHYERRRQESRKSGVLVPFRPRTRAARAA